MSQSIGSAGPKGPGPAAARTRRALPTRSGRRLPSLGALTYRPARRFLPYREPMMTSQPSKLAQLRELSVVVADTGDYDAIKRLKPVDCTTNPTLVKKALDLPVYAELIERELAWGREQGGGEAVVNEVADRLTVGVGAMLAALCSRPRLHRSGRRPGARHRRHHYQGAQVHRDVCRTRRAAREDPDQGRRHLGRRGSRAPAAARRHRLQPHPDLQPDPGAGLRRGRGVPDLPVRWPHP